MYDIIIVGARCAGAPTAMLLARMGYRTLLVDRTKFPSDIISTHLIWQTGTAHLKRWGTSRTRRGFQLPVDFQGHLRFRRLCPEGLGNRLEIWWDDSGKKNHSITGASVFSICSWPSF
jgi:2-polyprenyl-6-methoxyphenol hydroxylase-like FAD-dependent oxidoreductase